MDADSLKRLTPTAEAYDTSVLNVRDYLKTLAADPPITAAEHEHVARQLLRCAAQCAFGSPAPVGLADLAAAHLLLSGL